MEVQDSANYNPNYPKFAVIEQYPEAGTSVKSKRKISSHNQGLNLANHMLKEIAKSEIIITSRIHAALPALAMGLKVIFINEGLSHKNHKTRTADVNKFFMTVSLEEFFMTNLETIQKRNEHKVYFKKINETITKFMNE